MTLLVQKWRGFFPIFLPFDLLEDRRLQITDKMGPLLLGLVVDGDELGLRFQAECVVRLAVWNGSGAGRVQRAPIVLASSDGLN